MSRVLATQRRVGTPTTARVFTYHRPTTLHFYSNFIGNSTCFNEFDQGNSGLKGRTSLGIDQQAAILRGSQTETSLARQQQRGIHTSPPTENPVIVGGIAVAAGAIALRYGVEYYQAWAAKRKSSVADVSKYYKGDFEEEMTRREASLILGVRESANKTRIRERYKKMLILNHPDRGGSTYLAGKINEANELLTRGK
eukprot:gb/GECG01005482.1/.p1 GENE.gb/GECG01005482.1/~~gb/GECG01005482.1/.p1  ORF type:complete len:197 (+),score=17.79 gb/GECG01005482.1/:1-591(+)